MTRLVARLALGRRAKRIHTGAQQPSIVSRLHRRAVTYATATSIVTVFMALAPSGPGAYAQSAQSTPSVASDVAVGRQDSARVTTQTSPQTDPDFRGTPKRAAANAPEKTLSYDDKLTGDWGGARTRLHDWGVDIRLKYTSETAGNPVGGRNQGTAYTQQIALGGTFDLQKLVGLEGGQVVFTLNSRAGTDSKSIIGSLRSPQELYGAGENTRISDLYYIQKLYNDRVEFKLGFSSVGNDFATSDTFCYFQSGAYCGHTPAMVANSGWYNYPTGQWGGRVKVTGASDVYFQTGIYQVDPHLSDSAGGFNFDLGFHGTGVLVPIEFGWLPEHAFGGMPGKYKIGAYFDSSDAPDVLRDALGGNAALSGLPRAVRSGRWGAWVQGEQMIYREPGTANRGVTIFGTVAAGDPETAQYTFTGMVGIVQKGIGNRDADYVAAAVGMVHSNRNTTLYQQSLNSLTPGIVNVVTDETIYEIGYGAQLTPYFLLRPNLQYIQRPGGTGLIPNAFVLGLTATVDF